MQKLTCRKSIAWLLLAICLQWMLPRELWHELTHHHDTEDCQVAGNARLNFSEQHDHCLILELSMPPVVHEDAQTITFVRDFYHKCYSAVTPAPVFTFIITDNSRGPPILFL